MTLVPTWRLGDLVLTDAPFAMKFGADHGSPENISEVLRSLLQDGDVELSTRAGNRTLVLPLLIEDGDLGALAQAEADLIAECDKVQNDLYFDPGDGLAAPMVFTVFRGQLVFARDDDYEQAGYRSYTLTFRALPYPRSEDEVTASALAASGTTTTVINSASATTGWTSSSGAVTSTGSVVKTTESADAEYHDLTLTGAVAMTGFPYVYVDWTANYTIAANFRAYVDGVRMTRIAQVPLATAGWYRSYFECSDTSVAAFKFEAYNGSGTNTGTFEIDQVVKTDVRPSLGSTRQLIRSIAVSGSVRTQGRLAIEHATSALGDVIVYTYPDTGVGYVPALKNYASSAITTDATMVSGGRYTIAGIPYYTIPATTLPDGMYLLVGRLRKTGGTASQSIKVTASTWIGSNPLDAATEVTSTYTMTSTWTNYSLGKFHLPSVDVSDATAAATVRITITDTDSTDDVDIDELWAFNLTTGRLTMVQAGTGAPAAGGDSNRLYLLPPTVEHPRPRVLLGTAADGSDAYHPAGYLGLRSVTSWMDHEFEPPSMAVFTVTSNALDASVTLSHYPRWHSHAVT